MKHTLGSSSRSFNGSATSPRLSVLCALMFAFFGGGCAVQSEPAQIILFRHAEKPEDRAQVHLSSEGQERAKALVSLLGPSSTLTTGLPVAALYATKVTKHDHSSRTGETLAPLAAALRLPVIATVDSEDFRDLARTILRNSRFQGKTVIVCWTHHDIAQFAAALGVKPEPAAWKDKVFDRFWVIDYRSGKAVLKDVPQHLLKGDSKH